ncbi:MAG TPA: hypothetical protein VFT12_15055 [Thermoanaerobaculia bacterium]|nr:hypothetical protein [Thermoanaerobaculia bacterium]
MIKKITILLMMSAASAGAVEREALQRVYTDAVVIDRVAEASRKDLPDDLLERMVNEDIDLLRGKRNDGSYEHATYERLEASRSSSSHSVQPRRNDEMERIDLRGSWIYRLIVDSPSRRLLLTKNRPVYLDRLELEYIPEGSSDTRRETITINETLEPGKIRTIDLPEVARQATARLFARADSAEGYGNLELTLVHARVVDNVDSPYADAVATAKALLRAIDAREVPSIRAMAARLRDSLAPYQAVSTTPQPVARQMEVVAPPVDTALYTELQIIEDLLTGDEAERRDGLDRLHQLVRKLRP